MKKIAVIGFGSMLLAVAVSWSGVGNSFLARAAEQKTYVGSETCMQCHEAEYENFTRYAKKAASYGSIAKMEKGLTKAEIKGCYACHTTGYGQPGGFVSTQETPHLKNAGCEVCHGPGSLHVETEDSDNIKADLDMKDCLVCHNSARIDSFKFKPMLHGGAH